MQLIVVKTHFHSKLSKMRRKGDLIEVSKEELKVIKGDKIEGFYSLVDGKPITIAQKAPIVETEKETDQEPEKGSGKK